MLDREAKFPCIFGVDAVAKKTLRYGFVSADDQARQLADILTEFTQICESLGKRTSLVCFFESWHAERTQEAYYERFWQLLSDTSRLDLREWPEEFGPDTDDSRFEYCFNGVPLFVVVNTDLHEKRRSRYFERVAITFQPRFVFDDLQPNTAPGENAREIIRARIGKYDQAPLTRMLGNFGDHSNNEWRQYYLDDGEDVISTGKCPVHFAKENVQR